MTRLKSTLVAAVLMVGAIASAKQNSFVCNHPDVPGGWGALDLGCDADQYGDLSRIKLVYPKFVYDRRIPGADGVEHEKDYITNMNAIIRKVAKDYYLSREPHPKPATLAAWMRAAAAVGAHESMLSHYRIAKDGRYKLMTGDHLVSHGVMQVNQEFHANKNLDSSFDLVGNIVAALDTYYMEWTAATKQQCFWASNGKQPTLDFMLQNRARSAYSAYNGGPARLCRYTIRSRWHLNDDKFIDMYKNQPWYKYVRDPNAPAPINTQCLVNGDDLCAMSTATRAEFMKSRPLLLKDGKTCVTADGVNFTCATDARIFTCLAKIDSDILENDPLKIDQLPAGSHVAIAADREPLCFRSVQGLMKIGTPILLKKEILMRETIGGTPVGNTRAGRIYQVQDYDLRLFGKTERYYKITTSGGAEGWIYGGTDDDRQDWIVEASAQDLTAAAEAAAKAKADREARKNAEAEKKSGDIVVIGRRPTPTPAPAATATPVITPVKLSPPPILPDPVIDDGKLAPVTFPPVDPVLPKSPAPVVPEPAAAPAAPATSPSADNEDDDGPVAVLPVKGSVIEIVKADGIVLRATPGEDQDKSYIDQLYKTARLTVEDVVTKGTENCIYLKVSAGGKTGWIYVGRTFPDVTISKWIKIWK